MEFVIGMVGFVFGIICGIAATLMNHKPKTMGTIRRHVDPDDGPYLFLELKSDPSEVMRQQYVIFDVNPEDFISQK